MNETSNNVLIDKLLTAIERKQKGIKHSFKSWTKNEIDNSDGIELVFERWSERPSRLTVSVWYDGELSIDLRTYGKHQGWTFEHRKNGSLSDSKINDLISLIKNISIYFDQEMVNILDKKIENLAK